MATVKDILGTDSLKFENEFKAQGLSGDKLESAMIKLARDTRTQRENQNKTTQTTQKQAQDDRVNNLYGGDSFTDKVGRGLAETATRFYSLGNYLGLVPEEHAKVNAQILDDLEKRREIDSNKNIQFNLDEVKKDIQDYKTKPAPTQMEQQQYAFDLERLSKLELRPTEKEALKQESSDAKGFVDNSVVGIKTLVDTAMHPTEWTTQGVVAGVTDASNVVSAVTGGIGGKIALALGGKLLARTSVGMADGIAVGAGMEYGVAKGTFKSDEEAKKAAIQSGVANVVPAAYGAMAANIDPRMPKLSQDESQVSETLNTSENKPQISEIQKKKAYSNVFSSPFLKNQETNTPLTPEETSLKLEDGFSGEMVDDVKKETLIKNELDKENINMIKNIAQAEQDSISFHENTKLKLQEAMNNGASIDEMMAIRNNIEITDSEAMISKIINNDEPTTNRLAGFKIVSVIEDTIKNSKLTPDEVKQKLIDENINPDLATVATKSYILKKTDILIDFIQNKVDAHLDATHTNLKKDIEAKVDLYNKQKIADEELWTNSITKKSLDDYISKEIGDDNISANQRDLIQELNKIGLVEDVVSAKLKNNINGQYDMSNNNITLNNSIPNIQKAQVLTHEYVHSALGRLIENKKFNEELTFLMADAKKEFKANKKDVNQYGFTNVQDFAAEAFSNPYLARDLNEVKLSANAKVKLGVKEYINTLWEAIVTKFNDVIFESTGKRIKLNPDSYYGALNSMIDRELTHLQNIKEQKLNDGTSLASELKQVVEIKPTLFDNLKLHPRYEELLSMREDVKATDIKYDKKVLNKGTVVHDENRFGGTNKTQIVPSSYERNYNADFKLTKKDIENIRNGKTDENIIQKIKDDLSTLDNHPDWKKYSEDVNIEESKDILGEDFNDSYYINKDGKLVDNGKVLFSKDSDLGSDYIEFKSKPDEAIDHLLEVQNGQVNGAIYKEGIGSIDFVWGESRIQAGKVKGYGLAKIKDKHGIDAVRNIPNVIKNGVITKKSDKHIEISDGIYNAVVYLDWFDGVKNWLMTSYEKKPNSQTFTDVNSKVEKSDNLISKVSSNKIVSNKKEKSQIKKKNDENFPLGKNEESNILYSKNFTGKNKTLPERMDALTDKTIDKLDNLFKGLTPDGNLKPQTNPLMDIFRTLLVPDAHKQKQFVELLRNNNKEKARQKIIAKKLQEDLNAIPKKENELLVMALDGDIAKEDIKVTLGDELYGHYEVMRKQIDDNANELVKLGMLDEASKKEDYIKRFYKEHLEKQGLLSGLFKSGHKLDKNFKRKDLTKEQRDKLEQIRDAGYVVARTLLEQNNQIRKAKFLNTLADEFSVNEEKAGFVQVPLKKDGSISVFGNLSGKYVPEHIMNELNGLYEFGKGADNIVQKNVKNFSRWLKGSWTAGNPSTHLYNVGSNMINLYLNGHLFTIKNGRTIVGGSKGVEGLKKFFSKDTREAYKKELTEAGLYDDSFFTTLETLVDDLDAKTKDNWSMKDIYNGVLFKKDSKITKAVENVYDLEDKIFRIFVYEEQKWDAKVEKYKKKFGKIDSWSEAREKIEAIELDPKEKLEAMNEARDTFVDYSKPVPNWISVLDNYMVAPFARYTYLATIRQTKVAIKHPFRAAALSFGFGEALKEIFGDEDENLDDKDPLKPDWMKTSASNFNMYRVQNFTKLGDTKDEASYFNTGRLIPGFRMFEATLGFYAELIDTIKDKENKFGQKFVQEHNTKLEVLAKTLSKTSEMILPPLFPIAVPVIWNQPRLTEGGNIKEDKDGNLMKETVVIGGRYGQKLMGAASGSSLDRYGQPVPPTDVIKQMLGIKMQTINKKDEASKQLLSLEKKYKPEIQREKSLGNPKAQKEKQEEYTRKIEEIKKAAPGFNLGDKKDEFSFNDKSIKFDF